VAEGRGARTPESTKSKTPADVANRREWDGDGREEEKKSKRAYRVAVREGTLRNREIYWQWVLAEVMTKRIKRKGCASAPGEHSGQNLIQTMRSRQEPRTKEREPMRK
jgi:hypothetical protein